MDSVDCARPASSEQTVGLAAARHEVRSYRAFGRAERGEVHRFRLRLVLTHGGAADERVDVLGQEPDAAAAEAQVRDVPATRLLAHPPGRCTDRGGDFLGAQA